MSDDTEEMWRAISKISLGMTQVKTLYSEAIKAVKNGQAAATAPTTTTNSASNNHNNTSLRELPRSARSASTGAVTSPLQAETGIAAKFDHVAAALAILDAEFEELKANFAHKFASAGRKPSPAPSRPAGTRAEQTADQAKDAPVQEPVAPSPDKENVGVTASPAAGCEVPPPGHDEFEHMGHKARWEYDAPPAGIVHDEKPTLTLLPTAEQRQDVPGLLAVVQSLDYEKGFFKIHDAASYPLPPPPPARRKAAQFSISHLGGDVFRLNHISVVPTFGPPADAATSLPPRYVSVAEAIGCATRLLATCRASGEQGNGANITWGSRAYYRFDVPAHTPSERLKSGLSAESPIAPLKGNQLALTRASIAGIHTVFAYEASDPEPGHPGAPFGWHVEDNGTMSFSHLHAGQKIWMCIAPQHAAAAERHLRRIVTNVDGGDPPHCTQWVRHQSAFSLKAFCDDPLVPVSFVSQRAGETIVTLPGTYHAGFSTTYTLAEAVNYAPPGYAFGGAGTTECDRAICPIAPLYNRLFDRLGPGESQEPSDVIEAQIAEADPRARNAATSPPPSPSSPSSSPSPPPSPAAVHSSTTSRKRRASNAAPRPPPESKRLHLPRGPIIELAAKVTAASAFEQLRDLVAGCRAEEAFGSGGDDGSTDQTQRHKRPVVLFPGQNDTGGLAGLVVSAELRGGLFFFVARLAKVHLAATIDATKADGGLQRVSHAVISSVLTSFGRDPDSKSHQAWLQRRLASGRMWVRMRSSHAFPGLLALVLPPETPGGETQYTSLLKTDRDANIFANAVRQKIGDPVAEALSAAAVELIEAIETNKPVPLFAWEAVDDAALRKTLADGCLSNGDIVALVRRCEDAKDANTDDAHSESEGTEQQEGEENGSENGEELSTSSEDD